MSNEIRDQRSICQKCKYLKHSKTDETEDEAHGERDSIERDNDPPSRSSIPSKEDHTCFEVRVGQFAADILALSLFASESPDAQFPRLRYPDLRAFLAKQHFEHRTNALSNGTSLVEAKTWEALISNGWWPALSGDVRILCFDSYAVFRHVLDLTSRQDNEKMAVLSADLGQVIYPSVLGAQIASRDAHFQLKCIPGHLDWNGQSVYALVSEYPRMERHGPSRIGRSPSRPAQDLLKVDYVPHASTLSFETLFSISMTDETMEYLHLYLAPGGSFTTRHYTMNAWALLDGISQTVFSPPCRHKADSPVGDLKEDIYLKESESHTEISISTYEPRETPLLIPAHENHTLQLLELANAPEPCVLHRDGCLGCALKLAKKLRIKIIIC